MNYISGALVHQTVDSTYSVKNICRIIGLVCITGFIFDMVMLGIPPQESIEWRMSLIQELANRSIILLFGLALFIFGSISVNKSRLKLAAKLSMTIGVLFFLLCPLSIADSVRLSRQSASAISAQESQLQTEIKAAQGNPKVLSEDIDPTSLKYASQQLTQQAIALKKTAKQTVFKTSISSIGNLLIVGAGLVVLGRSGMIISRLRE